MALCRRAFAPQSATKAGVARLKPLSVGKLAVLAVPNITRSIDYRHPADPARYDPTC
jgi:hypothetical protein